MRVSICTSAMPSLIGKTRGMSSAYTATAWQSLPGISGHLVASLGISWHLLASLGISWHLLASLGISGYLLKSRGISKHLAASSGISRYLAASRGISHYLVVSRGISYHRRKTLSPLCLRSCHFVRCAVVCHYRVRRLFFISFLGSGHAPFCYQKLGH
jgi:hypothetical protein